MNISSTGTANSTDYSRISGLASGMDIDSIVDGLMVAESQPLNKLEQQKQILEWQQEDYRSLNTALYSLKEAASGLRLQGTFLARTTSVGDATVLTATAANNAGEGAYTITVTQLAAGVSKGSAVQLAEEKAADGSSLSLFEQFSEFGARGYTSADTITVNINGTDLEFNLDTDNIGTVVSKINAADLGVRASYDNNYNRFFLTTSATGSAAAINISADSANFFGSGTNSSILQLNINVGASYNGQNAVFSIGDATGMESAANNVSVNGLTLALRQTGTTTVTVAQDTDTIVASVKAFVEAYNDTLDKLYDKLTEKRSLDYKPLTDAQKKDMSDKEIEKWEEKARSGLLRSDPTLQKVVDNLRSTLTRMVSGLEGSFSSLSQIGITTGSYAENGKIHLDEDKLKQALAADADGVKELFTHSSAISDEKGIGTALYSALTDGIKYISDKAGSDSSLAAVDRSYIGKRLTELKGRIDDWEDRLERIKERYYKRFTAMEQAINTMNAQSAWITAQFFSSSG